jgi:hypothetical protein
LKPCEGTGGRGREREKEDIEEDVKKDGVVEGTQREKHGGNKEGRIE